MTKNAHGAVLSRSMGFVQEPVKAVVTPLVTHSSALMETGR